MLLFLNYLQQNCTLFSYCSYQFQCYMIYRFRTIKDQRWEMFSVTHSTKPLLQTYIQISGREFLSITNADATP